MALREELERQGAWLFRWRSYIPLATVVLFAIALYRFEYPFQSEIGNRLWEFVCMAVSFLGLTVRAHATSTSPRGSSGRNTNEQRAQTLNITGMYSICRHPLYLGNFLMWIGAVLSIGAVWLFATFVLFFWIYYERIAFAEEEFLRRKFGEPYLNWALRTPPFVPNFRSWTPPALPFAWRNAVRREFSGFYALITAYYALHLAKVFLTEGSFALDPVWTMAFLGGTIVYLAIVFLKKKTRVLDLAGR